MRSVAERPHRRVSEREGDGDEGCGKDERVIPERWRQKSPRDEEKIGSVDSNGFARTGRSESVKYDMTSFEGEKVTNVVKASSEQEREAETEAIRRAIAVRTELRRRSFSNAVLRRDEVVMMFDTRGGTAGVGLDKRAAF